MYFINVDLSQLTVLVKSQPANICLVHLRAM